MNLYFISRWGNPVDGPNGKDTNFLVVANSESEAGGLADACLRDHPEVNGTSVTDYCHVLIKIGDFLMPGLPSVIHGPWIESCILRGYDDLPSWHRLEFSDEWKIQKEFYGY